jgi:hypothetical protein
MSDLRKLARGQQCLIRLSGVCNHDPATTVLAHARLQGISGMGIKSPDLLGAWACSACHAYVDKYHDKSTKADFYEGILRTQAALLKAGAIRV